MKNAIVLMMSDSHGVYIPQNFLDDIDRAKWIGISNHDADVIQAGPDHEWYWDSWDSVLNSASYTDEIGNKYTLHQDGDLWAICPELMDNEEYQNFFGEMKPAPDNSYEFAVCSDCLIALANDDYSGMDDKQEKATRDGLAVLSQEYDLIPDGAEYGFMHSRCECCDGLPGDRFRLVSLSKRGEK